MSLLFAMSLASKITFLSSCVFTGSIIVWVHKQQGEDREKLRQVRKHKFQSGKQTEMIILFPQGIVRDLERQERKRQNQIA